MGGAMATALDEVFRFMLRRPPITSVGGTIPVPEDTDFKQQLRVAIRREGSAARNVARRYLASGKLPKGVDELATAGAVRTVLERLASTPVEDDTQASALLGEAFQGELEDVVADREFMRDWRRVTDWVLSVKYANQAIASDDQLMPALRVLGAVRHAAAAPPIDGETQLVAVLTQGVAVFPADSDDEEPPSERPQRPVDRVPGDDVDKPDRNVDSHRGTKLTNAIEELMALERSGRVQTTASTVRLERPAPETEGLLQRGLRSLGAASGRLVPVAFGSADGAQAGLTLDRDGMKALTPATRDVLHELDIDVSAAPLPGAVNALHQALTRAPTVAPVARSLTMMKHGISVAVPLHPAVRDAIRDVADTDPRDAVPTTTGFVRPAGIADLLVVRQQIKSYDGGEVGHIENVLRGESKERTHRSLERSEQSFLVETEELSEDTHEHSSTERFEMQREASRTIESDASLKAGLSVSGSYGPTVDFSTSFEVSMSTSSSETSRVASQYAKDVSSRSVKRLVQRKREQREQRLIRELEEVNRHSVDNSGGPGHVSGVYQWVDKVYEAEIFCYGKRLLFDVMIPEPAAFAIHAMVSSAETPTLPSAPQPFTLMPEGLTESNYGTYVARYGATGVSPPPAPYICVAKTFEERSGDGDGARLTKAAELPIPDGYMATSASARWAGAAFSGSWFEVFVGDRRFDGGYTSLNNLRGTIPVGMQSGKVSAFTLAIQVNCQRTQELLAKWRLSTFDAVRQAYLERVREFEGKLAELLARSAGVVVQGRNPTENRRTERTEIKKAALSLITAQRFESFDAMGTGSTYPEFDFDEAQAEGAYVRFFENAFEWEQMTYLFYPYFWGRKEHWIERFLTEDVDPQFAEFLRAGAARCVLPVRPGFEAAVLHYLETGEIWNGQDAPPDVTSPLYVSIVQEMRERTGDFDNETPVGTPWDVRLPTTLVKLRADDSLPTWQKQADGTWQPT